MEHIDRFVGLTDFHCQQMVPVSLLNLVALLPLILDGQSLLSQVNVCGLDNARWLIIYMSHICYSRKHSSYTLSAIFVNSYMADIICIVTRYIPTQL